MAIACNLCMESPPIETSFDGGFVQHQSGRTETAAGNDR